MSREVQEYWSTEASSEDKQEIFKNQRDWSDHDEDGDWECDDDWGEDCEDGHTPRGNRLKRTNCIYCDIKLVRMYVNNETVYVDPDELVKLKKWNEMTCGGGR